MKKIVSKKRHIALIAVFVFGVFGAIFLGMSFSCKIPNHLTEYSGVIKEAKLIKPTWTEYIFQSGNEKYFKITFEDSSKIYKISGTVLDGFDIESFNDKMEVGQSVTILAESKSSQNEYRIYKLTAGGKDYLSLEDSKKLTENNKFIFTVLAVLVFATIAFVIIGYCGVLIYSKFKPSL